MKDDILRAAVNDDLKMSDILSSLREAVKRRDGMKNQCPTDGRRRYRGMQNAVYSR